MKKLKYISKVFIFIFCLLFFVKCTSVKEKYPEEVQLIERIINDKGYLSKINKDTNHVHPKQGVINFTESQIKNTNNSFYELFHGGYEISIYNENVPGQFSNNIILDDCLLLKVEKINNQDVWTLIEFCISNGNYKLTRIQIGDAIY